LLITKGSVESSIRANFPTVSDIYVVGYGDDEMDRDIVYSVTATDGFNPYIKSDFYGKSKGETSFNRSVGYEHSSDRQTPDLNNFSYELSDSDYKALSINDLNYFTHRGGLIFEEYFLDGNIENRGWLKADSGLEFGETYYGSSVRVINVGGVQTHGLRLGALEPTYAPIGGL
jgi:hypothetical protein